CIPGCVDTRWARLSRAHSVHPAITGGEVAARITHEWNLQSRNSLEDIAPSSTRICQWRFGAVDAAINTTTEMLNEAAENVTVDAADTMIEVDCNVVHGQRSAFRMKLCAWICPSPDGRRGKLEKLNCRGFTSLMFS